MPSSNAAAETEELSLGRLSYTHARHCKRTWEISQTPSTLASRCHRKGPRAPPVCRPMEKKWLVVKL
jgi:hypothetical protein